MPTDRAISWLGRPLLVTALAGVLRFGDLARPKADRVRRDLLREGRVLAAALRATSAASSRTPTTRSSPATATGATSTSFTDEPGVRRPPAGRQVGHRARRVRSSGSPRSAGASRWPSLGTLAVLLTVPDRAPADPLHAARRASPGSCSRSTAWRSSMSRTALLDGTLMLWVLVAFGCLLIDRDRTRRRLAAAVRRFPDDRAAMAELGAGLGPRTGLRPWRWAAGLRARARVRHEVVGHLVPRGVRPHDRGLGRRHAARGRRAHVAGGGRLGDRGDPRRSSRSWAPRSSSTSLSWTGWFRSDSAYDRNWADTNPASGGWGWMPDALRSLWHYHAEMLGFHTNLTSPHSYQSNAWGWLRAGAADELLLRGPRPRRRRLHGRQVLDRGRRARQPAHLVGRHARAGAPGLALDRRGATGARARSSLAVLAGWLPWLGFQGRTIFTFYAVVFVPFLCIALAMSLGSMLGPGGRRTAAPGDRRHRRRHDPHARGRLRLVLLPDLDRRGHPVQRLADPHVVPHLGLTPVAQFARDAAGRVHGSRRRAGRRSGGVLGSTYETGPCRSYHPAARGAPGRGKVVSMRGVRPAAPRSDGGRAAEGLGGPPHHCEAEPGARAGARRARGGAAPARPRRPAAGRRPGCRRTCR